MRLELAFEVNARKLLEVIRAVVIRVAYLYFLALVLVKHSVVLRFENITA